jgi:hypothetical protein
MRPSKKKILHKKGLVEWLKVQSLSLSPSTKKKKERKAKTKTKNQNTCSVPVGDTKSIQIASLLTGNNSLYHVPTGLFSF